MAKSDSEEVNLLDLLASFMAALKRNLIFTILFPTIGIAIALAIAFKSRDLFESSLLIETSLLSENESKFLFDQLDRAGTFPGLTDMERSQLAGFRYKVFRNEQENEFNEKSLFLEVTARVFNKEVFPALETAVLKLVNENPSVVRHRRERQKFYTELVDKIGGEIAAMDAIKKGISINTQANFINPAGLYSSTVDLYKQKIQFEIRREQVKTVHLIKGFDSLTVDARMSKSTAAVIGFVIGFGCLCAFLFLRFFLTYFTNYEITH
jgi:hypothetical protein